MNPACLPVPRARDDALAGFFPRDIIDQEIHQICESWPTILEDNTIIRKSQGRYRINGREVSISLVTHEGKDEEDGREGLPRCSPDVVSLKEITTSLGGNPDDLIVRDGPLTQPFLDYVFDTGEKESYAMEISADGRSSMPLASDMKGGQLVADPGDRLEVTWQQQDMDVPIHGCCFCLTLRLTRKLRQPIVEGNNIL